MKVDADDQVRTSIADFYQQYKNLIFKKANEMANDPDYFFNMAPYALALGVINPYSRAFNGRKLEQCPYLITKTSEKRPADEWGHILADVADLMDYKSRRMQIEKWFAVKVVRSEPQEKRKPRTKK